MASDILSYEKEPKKPSFEKRFVLKHVFRDVINLEKDEVIDSEWEDHFNVNWLISVERLNNHFGLFVHLEAKVKIIETTGFGKEKIREFDESQKDVSDVIIVVRSSKFYLSKMYLASQSSFFKSLFIENRSVSNKPEIALPGIDPNDFHYFLEVLYGEPAIDDSN
ncbi:unnamed protein product [Caenorhabditis nigoni]